MTYQSIAELVGISRAKIGQILAKAELEMDAIDWLLLFVSQRPFPLQKEIVDRIKPISLFVCK